MYSALDLAQLNGHDECAELLLHADDFEYYYHLSSILMSLPKCQHSEVVAEWRVKYGKVKLNDTVMLSSAAAEYIDAFSYEHTMHQAYRCRINA